MPREDLVILRSGGDRAQQEVCRRLAGGGKEGAGCLCVSVGAALLQEVTVMLQEAADWLQ